MRALLSDGAVDVAGAALGALSDGGSVDDVDRAGLEVPPLSDGAAPHGMEHGPPGGHVGRFGAHPRRAVSLAIPARWRHLHDQAELLGLVNLRSAGASSSAHAG